MPKQYRPIIQLEDIQREAIEIRDVAQAIINFCESEQPFEGYARNKVAGGALAKDAAALGIMLVAYEIENRE